jgi:cobalt-zinc-cadmium efflux system outer membrane protein
LNKTFGAAVLALVILSPIASPAQADNEEGSPLAILVQQALANNPRIEAALQQYRAAGQKISQAGALPDPQVTLGLMNLPVNSFSFDQEPMTGKVVGIMQMFPFPGKQALAANMARIEASAMKQLEEEVRGQIVQAVKRVYFDIFAVDRARETAERNLALMKQFVRVAEARYATGSGLQQDVLRAQVELARLEDGLLQWDQKRRSLEARLNALLNRPEGSGFEITRPELDLPASDPPPVSAEGLAQTRPLLRAWTDRLEKAGVAVKFATRDRWPNFTVGASYSQRDNLQNGAVMHDFLSVTFSLNIPLFTKRKQGAAVAERALDRAAAEAGYRNALNVVMADAQSAKAALEQSRKRVALFEGGILLQARQSLDSARAGYEAGKVDFLTLINNAMMVENYEQQYYAALADYFKALADFEFAAGTGTAAGAPAGDPENEAGR